MTAETTATDTERAAALRRMKILATGLLVVMAVIFVVAFALQDTYPWLQYVRAASEGGMVGALADWFAVTALFKYPMGLKIPHTAIIPRKKDQIGESLGQFVEENFLSEDVVRNKLDSVGIAQKAGAWLEKPESADRVAAEGAALIRGAFTVLNDDVVQGVIESMVRKHLIDPPWGPPIGSIAEHVFAEGHHHRLVDLLVDRTAEWVDANYAVVTRVVAQRSPTWVPRLVDGVVGDRVHAELSKFIRAVQEDQQHDVRLSIDKYLRDLAQDLQHKPETIAKAEEIKGQLLDDPRVRDITARTWATIKKALLEAVNDPESELTRKFKAAVRDFGSRLTRDTELAGKVNRWVADGASYAVRTYRSEISSVIAETVGRWDAADTSRKIELQVGRDLQFIRINGTVVGSLAGLVIFTIAHAIFG